MRCAWAITCWNESSIGRKSNGRTQRNRRCLYRRRDPGLALVTFPAASNIFTSPQYYELSSTAYGIMFLPQAVTAMTASLLGAGLTRRLGIKRIYLLGLAADLVSMALFFLSQFVMSNGSVAYRMLLLATASLGMGFGLTVPVAQYLRRRLLSAAGRVAPS